MSARSMPIARTHVVRALLGGAAAVALAACGGGSSPPVREGYDTAGAHLTVEVAGDDLLHFEWSAANSPRTEPILTSPMIASADRPGPSRFGNDGHGTLSTATLRIAVDPGSLCLTVTDIRQRPPTGLTTMCPSDLDARTKSITVSQESTEHLYGLGEHFLAPGQANGDLLGRTIAPGNPDGNAILSFNGGNTGNAQFPILYAFGDGRPYALFLDQPHAQTWDFSADPWRATMDGDAIRGYFIGGRDAVALRRRYMDLVGRPPVPPKKMFGLWVSEFGYDNWSELEDKLRTLRANNFPVDGFVLDLQWYGGVFHPASDIGELRFDETNFPDPAGEIARLRDANGVGLMLIEEPYVDRSRSAYGDLAQRGYFVRACVGCAPVDFSDWWGHGSMLDWTSDAAGDYWHDLKRQALVDLGVLGHWDDLGEPDTFSPSAWYAGFPDRGLHDDADVHNLYSFDWAASIQRGYARHRVAARPFILSRSGTAGIDRFGAAMWSGDIGSNMSSLAAQLNVQMHMSFSGIDYFGSDVGGFVRSAADGDPTELYTQWFADSALFDVPLRPHTQNLCNCYETAPDRAGEPASNLANLRLRYRLVPYLYSLAHRAYRFGEPVVAPLAVYYAGDPTVGSMSDEKLLGRDLLAAAVSTYGQTARDVYLPAGTWVDFRSQEWLDSAGGWITAPTRRDDLLQLPLYARAGAIIPEMYVDEQTMNALGRRLDGSRHDELIVRVYADEHPTHFTVYEDDGATVAYQRGEVRTTDISQQRAGDTIAVSVAAAVGQYSGAPAVRDTVVELAARALPDAGPGAVALNGQPLAKSAGPSAFADATHGAWSLSGDGLLLLRSGPLPVETPKSFTVRLGSNR